MSWAMLMRSANIGAANADLALPAIDRIATSGKAIPVIVRANNGLTWQEKRFGLMFRQGGQSHLAWHARDDKLQETARWSRLVNQRCAFPIAAYADTVTLYGRTSEQWMLADGWMIGLYDDGIDGGSAFITVETEARRVPLVVDQQSMIQWLTAEQWNAFPLLRTLPRTPSVTMDRFASREFSLAARSGSGRIANAA